MSDIVKTILPPALFTRLGKRGHVKGQQYSDRNNFSNCVWVRAEFEKQLLAVSYQPRAKLSRYEYIAKLPAGLISVLICVHLWMKLP